MTIAMHRNQLGLARRKRQRAFTLVEVALSLVILMMMVMVFAAVFPLALRSASFSNNYAQAAFLAQHKIDQLRSAGWSRVVDSTKLNGSNPSDVTNVSGLSTNGIQIIDPSQTTAPFTFTTVDNLTGFFPSGSSGTVAVAPDTNVTTCVSGASGCTVVNLTVTISWTGGGMANGQYVAHAKLIQMIHR